MSESKPKLYPPVVFFLSALLMTALHNFAPIYRWADSSWQRAGIILVVAGFVQIILIKRMFDRAGTPIKPFEESTSLLTDGPFRFSRNPVYLSMVISLSGLAIVFGTASPVMIIPLFALFIQKRFIVPEEAMMRETFGDEYETYTRRVRRWI